MSPAGSSLQTPERPAVATHGLAKRWGGVRVLEHVEIEVPSGAFYLLAGRNGAGKSTLLRVLVDLVRPTAGRAEVLGMDPQRHGPAVRAAIGFVAGAAPAVADRASLGRKLEHIAAHYPTWDTAYASEITRAFDLHLERAARDATVNEVLRFRWVAALAHRPPLLLLDEPFAGFDPIARDAALAALSDHLATTETTAILATHDLEAAAGLADRVGVLDGGRCIVQASLETLLDQVHRYRVAVDPEWSPPPALAVAALERAGGGREIEWVVRGPRAWAVEAFQAGGGAVADIETLPAAEALRTILHTLGGRA